MYPHWLRLVEAEGATIIQGEAGLGLTLDRGLEMMVLYPEATLIGGREEKANNRSIVIRLTYGAVSILLPGDIEAKVEHRLAAEGVPLRSTVLKAAHHGSCTSTTQAFLDAVDPEVVVISVGADNDFGHPCDEVLERLGDVPVYRTDRHGTVEVISDGTRVWIDTDRGDGERSQ